MKIINLLVEITSANLHPSEVSTSVLSDTQDTLRRQEIDSHLCFKETWHKQTPKLRDGRNHVSVAQRSTPMPAHCIWASCVYPSLLLSAGSTYHVNVLFAPWTTCLPPRSTCSGAILHQSGVFPYQRPQKLLSVCCKVPPNWALI